MIRSRATAFLSVLAGVTVLTVEPATANDRFTMSDSAEHTHTAAFQQRQVSCSIEYSYQLNQDTHQLHILTQVGPSDDLDCRIPGGTHTYVRATYFDTSGDQQQSEWFSGASTVDVTIPNVSTELSGSTEPAIKTDHYASWDTDCVANCVSPVYSLMGGAGKNV